MKLKKIIAVSIIGSAFFTNLAFARDATQAELKALNSVVDTYQQATVDKNVDALLDGIPPRVITILTEITKPVDGVMPDVDQIKENIRRDITAFTNAVKVISWKVDLKDKKAGTLDVSEKDKKDKKTGDPFFVVPSTTIVELKVKKQDTLLSSSTDYELKRQKIISDVIAVLDDGKWYILSADNPMQLLVYQRAFPGIEKATLRKPVFTDTK